MFSLKHWQNPAVTLKFSSEVESPQTWHLLIDVMPWKIVCAQWQGCWDHADKISTDGTQGTQDKATDKVGGNPIC